MAPGAERVVLSSEFSFTELTQPFAQRLMDYSKGTSADKDRRIQEEPYLAAFASQVKVFHTAETRASRQIP